MRNGIEKGAGLGFPFDFLKVPMEKCGSVGTTFDNTLTTRVVRILPQLLK